MSRFLVGAQKIIPGNTSLRQDGSQSGRLDGRVVWHSETVRASCPARTPHGNVLSRTTSNPRAWNAAMTLDFGASTGNLAIRLEWSPPRRRPPGAVNHQAGLKRQTFRCETGLRI